MIHNLNERYQAVLCAIIQSYIGSGEPVGSRAIVKNYKFTLSPATIRNIMADLEDYGFLKHPHTSAGRIPTDHGFRFYVDKLKEGCRLSKGEITKLKNIFTQPSQQEIIHNLIEEAPKLLSSLSHYIGFVSEPKLQNTALKYINFVALTDNRILVVYVAQTGIIQNKVISVEEPISQNDLNKMAHLLNHKFLNLPLITIRKKIIELMDKEKKLYDKLLQKILDLSKQIIADDEEIELHIEGKENLLSYPELLVDIKKMKKIFAAFEKKSKICDILDKCMQESGQRIIIGEENEIKEMRDFSMVVSAYKRGDETRSYTQAINGRTVVF